MRPTCGQRASGPIYIAQGIRRVTQLIFCCRPDGMRLPPNGFSRKPCDREVTRGPRVINVDGNRSYPKVIAELKKTGELGRLQRSFRTLPGTR
jgi:hypothetical protein